MSQDPATPDQARRMESMIRLGTIAAVDHGAGRASVKSGQLTTKMLPWLERRAGTTRDWDPPTVGEQCMLLSPSGDPAQGIILVGIFSDAAPAPNDSPDECTREYPDGARFTYNHETGHLSITGIKTFAIEASDSGLIDCPQVTFTGKVTIENLLTWLNGMRGRGGSGSDGHGTAITGNIIHEDGSLSSNDVVLHTHHHVGELGGETGDPIAGSPWPWGWEP